VIGVKPKKQPIFTTTKLPHADMLSPYESLQTLSFEEAEDTAEITSNENLPRLLTSNS
jgi:hypothetical protein